MILGHGQPTHEVRAHTGWEVQATERSIVERCLMDLGERLATCFQLPENGPCFTRDTSTVQSRMRNCGFSGFQQLWTRGSLSAATKKWQATTCCLCKLITNRNRAMLCSDCKGCPGNYMESWTLVGPSHRYVLQRGDRPQATGAPFLIRANWWTSYPDSVLQNATDEVLLWHCPCTWQRALYSWCPVYSNLGNTEDFGQWSDLSSRGIRQCCPAHLASLRQKTWRNQVSAEERQHLESGHASCMEWIAWQEDHEEPCKDVLQWAG